MMVLALRPLAFKLDQTSLQPHIGHICVLFRKFIVA
jgi:hypothetical protein